MCVSDLYIIDEVNSTSYRHNGTKKNYELVTYNIPVKTGNKVKSLRSFVKFWLTSTAGCQRDIHR